MEPIDILILSNGPGEMATWVKPVVRTLRERMPDHGHVRISVVLSPCPNASGREAAIARSYPEVDRVQAAERFFPFLLWGKTVEGWDWRDRGVVIFLGGDQFYPVVIGRRLNYCTLIYAEWEARWPRWIDYFGVMKPAVIDGVAPKHRHKFTVVGDLMADVSLAAESAQRVETDLSLTPDTELIGLLPGSKGDKLRLGAPLALAIAEHIHAQRPQTRFVIPVAPMLTLETLAKYLDPSHNPFISLVDGVTADLVLPAASNQTPSDHPTTQALPKLKTPSGLEIDLWTDSPAYDLLARCRLCLTTVGANTAELGALAVPMLVLLPTQNLDALRFWDGIPGLLANLPIVGSLFAKLINRIVLRHILKQGRLFAWPNIWAGKKIVPELLGKITPQQIADEALDYLTHPEKLTAMSHALRQVRGETGASARLAEIVQDALDYPSGISKPSSYVSNTEASSPKSSSQESAELPR
ncbi:MAG: lipid-A-disaccharide synthase [Leptolyngbyaceae cyanobacterium MO_188.B28]|nr:lipid-A-disaccharide synthase [Leptolyngbyaceae cyanobacterium MO_188.B28]